MKVTFGKPSRDKRGKIGARAFVRIERDNWPVTYEFDTHGLSTEETSAKAAAIDARHTKWASRQNGFRAVVGIEFAIDARVYRIVSCTIPAGGPYEHVELMVSMREFVDDRLLKVDGFPRSFWFNSIDDVPPNAVIVALIREALTDGVDKNKKHETYVQNVQMRVQGGRDGTAR